MLFKGESDIRQEGLDDGEPAGDLGAFLGLLPGIILSVSRNGYSLHGGVSEGRITCGNEVSAINSLSPYLSRAKRVSQLLKGGSWHD